MNPAHEYDLLRERSRVVFALILNYQDSGQEAPAALRREYRDLTGRIQHYQERGEILPAALEEIAPIPPEPPAP